MLSENILALRKHEKLSQEQVAEKIGVSRQAVAKWESGETMPDIENCCALARLFSVSLDDLVNYDSRQSMGLPMGPKGKHFFGTVTVGDKGQIVIPVKARKIFSIEPGDDLVLLGDTKRGLALMKQSFLINMINRGSAPEDEET
ncbi:MAG: helix-turn-helix domain-containing protein [Oscillospiraceae bacterium]|nr:helix-turn-helix domain-containing protein [Oscillospiraceae bacterium]